MPAVAQNGGWKDMSAVVQFGTSKTQNISEKTRKEDVEIEITAG